MSSSAKSVKDLENPQKDGFLYKYGVKGIGAIWKKRWFVLHNGYLYYFKAVNSTKQSGTISLAVYNKIGETGKTKKYSFKLESPVPTAPIFYLCAENEEELTQWRREIISSVKGSQLSPRKSISYSTLIDTVKKICTLYINIAEGRNLPTTRSRDVIAGKSDPYLIADAGGCQARTRTIYKSNSPFWGEEYSLIISDRFTRDPSAAVKITVWDEDKFTKDTLIGQVMVPMISLSDKVHEQWYPLFPSDADIYVSGNLHLRIDHNWRAKTVTIRVLEGRNLASKDANGLSDPYVKVFFAKNKKKTNVVKKSLNPFFNEEFVFEVPESFYEGAEEHNADHIIHVSCWDWDRLGSNEFMGEVVIRLNELEASVIHDAWYLSRPVDNASSRNLLAGVVSTPNLAKPLGEIRVKLKYTEDPALPTYMYQPLLTILQGPNGPRLAQMVAQSTGPSERGELATTLVAACESYGSAVPLIVELSRDEISATPQEETIFRGNSLITKGLDAYMKLVAIQYLEHIIGPTIKKVYASKKHCEVDPTREKEEHIPKNLQRLLKLCNTVFTAVQSSVSFCPIPLREIFHNLQQTVINKFGSSSTARYSAVSSFLFLRFICPAILNPKLFGLTPDHPDQRTARVFTLLSKTIQNLANLVPFGQKEPYMLKLNDFIETNIPAMRSFLDQISTVPPSNTTTQNNGTNNNTIGKGEEEQVRTGAALLRYVDRAMPDLTSLLQDSNSPPLQKEVINELMPVYTKIKQFRGTSLLSK